LFGETLGVTDGETEWAQFYNDDPATNIVTNWMAPHALSLKQLWLWTEGVGQGASTTAVLGIDGATIASKTWPTASSKINDKGSVWDTNIVIPKLSLVNLRFSQVNIPTDTQQAFLSYGLMGTWLRD
jgi:hypothetical protein